MRTKTPVLASPGGGGIRQSHFARHSTPVAGCLESLADSSRQRKHLNLNLFQKPHRFLFQHIEIIRLQREIATRSHPKRRPLHLVGYIIIKLMIDIIWAGRDLGCAAYRPDPAGRRGNEILDQGRSSRGGDERGILSECEWD